MAAPGSEALLRRQSATEVIHTIEICHLRDSGNSRFLDTASAGGNGVSHAATELISLKAPEGIS